MKCNPDLNTNAIDSALRPNISDALFGELLC